MELSFGQRIDPENGLIECWFTHGALDEIKKMDLSDKVVWMWGAGMGDRWLKNMCKELHIVERTHDWLGDQVGGIRYYHRPCNEGSGAQDMYCEIPEGVNPDVFIVDDAYRYECIVKVLECSKKGQKDIILIVDNWQQDYVFICPSAEEILKKYKGKFFVQPDHKDHEGHPWQTAIWELPLALSMDWVTKAGLEPLTQ
jgi:hypothetical protein